MFARGEYRTVCIGRVDGVVLTVVYAEPSGPHHFRAARDSHGTQSL